MKYLSAAPPRDHRDANPFPTRRSTDLMPQLQQRQVRRVDHVADRTHAAAAQPLLQPRRRGRAAAACVRTATWSTRRRSAEHTSELQSRFELVCRLLPAKKTANSYSGTP